MNFTVDWKFVVALGVVTAIGIFSTKVDANGAKEVLINVVNACKEYAIAVSGHE